MEFRNTGQASEIAVDRELFLVDMAVKHHA
jgi:hypothetical protein